MLIKLKEASITFLKNTDFEVKAIDEVNFELKENEAVGVIGPVGSGKSTFGQALTGLLPLNLGSLTPTKHINRYCSYLFQKPEKQLFEDNVYNEIAFGPRNLGFSKDEVDLAVRDSMALVGLDFEKYASRSPFNMSGGEMRRVGIAATLSMGSKALVLDEPTAGLDANGKHLVLDLLKEMKQERSIVLISHDIEEVLKICERIVVFNKGKIVLDINAGEILKHVDFLSNLGLLLPEEYVLANDLKNCGYNIKGYEHDEILAAIKEKVSG